MAVPVLIPPPGATVRVGENDAKIAPGNEGTVAYIHPDTGNPVVLLDGGRRVAFQPDQLEVLTMPALTEALDRTAVRLHDGATAKAPRSEFTWTLFDPRPATVTLSPSSLRLSPGVTQMLNGAERVHLLFDRARNALALQPSTDEGASFKVRANAAGATVSARDFLKLVDFSGVRQGKPMRLVARREGGMVIVAGVPFLPG